MSVRRVLYVRVSHGPGVHLTGVHLTGMHLTGVHLTGVHLTGMHLTGVHLTGWTASCGPMDRCREVSIDRRDASYLLQF